MGVERSADVVCLHEPPRESGGIGISHSGYEIRKRKRLSMAVRRGSSLVVDELTDLRRGVNEDVIATNVMKERGEDNEDRQCLRPKEHAIRSETGAKVQLAESHSAG